MLTHHVFLKYRKETPQEHIEAFCQKVLALRESIAEILALEIGIDEFHEERSWSLVMMMQFENVDALRRYQKHSDHLAVMQFNAPYVIDVGALDFYKTLL